MPSLFTIGFITFDWGSLLSFLVGIMFGATIFALFYLYAVIKGLNKGLKLRSVEEEDIDEEEIKWLIKDAQNQFKNKETRQKEGFGPLLLSTSKSLSKDVASKFFPKSKYPHLELSIDESLILMKYISERLDELLSRRILSMLRGITLTSLLQLKETKDRVDQNLIVKTGLKTSKVVSKVLSVVNVVNPVYWFKKVVMNNVINVVLLKLGLAVIAITGEETYKIYSKKVFNKDKEIQTNVEDIYREIERVSEGDTGDEEEN